MSNVEDLISVVVPIYNVEKYVGKCIESIIGQTYSCLEIILVNDGSTDNSQLICEEYKKRDKRIKLINKSNGGLSDARNNGIHYATGKYITFIDSDDYVDNDMIEYLYSLAVQNQTDISICQHRVKYDDGKCLDYGNHGSLLLSGKECIEKMLYHDTIDTSAWAKLYKLSMFESICYPPKKLFEDIGTTYKLFFLCPYISVGLESKYNYICRNNSIVNGKFNISKLDLLEMTDSMATDVLNKYPELSDAVLRRQIYARFSTLNQMLDVNGFSKEKQDIICFLKNHRKKIMIDVRTPKRDKFGIILLTLGLPVYKLAWNLYVKVCK